MEQSSKSGIGVVVGRFQTDRLTNGHINLFEEVLQKRAALMVILGSSKAKNTKRNPLDFETRRQMIANEYPDAIIFNIWDEPTDESWSKTLDNIISENVPPGTNVMLYGSRDSFIQSYTGKFFTCQIAEKSGISGSEIRKTIGLIPIGISEFRRGAIYASQSRYDQVVMCVDIAPIMYIDGNPYLVMIRKNEDDANRGLEQSKCYRFIGGHADVKTLKKYGLDSNKTLELMAIKEAREEASIDIDVKDVHYLGSYYIPDWRYKDENDMIMSAFFVAKCSGSFSVLDICAGDDADEVLLISVEDFLNQKVYIVKEHKMLAENLRKTLKEYPV
jgi:bifunctional NMN adenylyltransferase/nudix hydrolase